MKTYDSSNSGEYQAETQRKWGKTDAYEEYCEKTKEYTAGTLDELSQGLDAVFKSFANCLNSGAKADSTDAQHLVEQLKNYITSNYYTCTNEILSGLGQMYVDDDRFKNNIDKHADGTAEFISQAIKIYCLK